MWGENEAKSLRDRKDEKIAQLEIEIIFILLIMFVFPKHRQTLKHCF